MLLLGTWLCVVAHSRTMCTVLASHRQSSGPDLQHSLWCDPVFEDSHCKQASGCGNDGLICDLELFTVALQIFLCTVLAVGCCPGVEPWHNVYFDPVPDDLGSKAHQAKARGATSQLEPFVGGTNHEALKRTGNTTSP